MVGVGVLSYNRPKSLNRLLDSMFEFGVDNTKIVVSDESDTKFKLNHDVEFVHNKRVGIAGNTNRLFDLLADYEYKLILNDDVEIKSVGWQWFYFNKMKSSNLHHFVMEPNWKPKNRAKVIGDLRKIDAIPCGAILAFDKLAFKTVGYFDVGFGVYGFEHVDWSNRISKSGIQIGGYYDMVGSNKYFDIHNGRSSIKNKDEMRKFSRNRFNKVKDDEYVYVGKNGR
jgi:GT2 family glycosyltransferase